MFEGGKRSGNSKIGSLTGVNAAEILNLRDMLDMRSWDMFDRGKRCRNSQFERHEKPVKSSQLSQACKIS